MKIKTVVSDIDATLLPPDSGIRLKDEVASIIYELEQSGVMMILASARAYAGVVPIAEQLHMDTLGGISLRKTAHLFMMRKVMRFCMPVRWIAQMCCHYGSCVKAMMQTLPFHRRTV